MLRIELLPKFLKEIGKYARIPSMNSSEPVATVSSSFTIGGQSFDPDELTSICGVTPTKLWRPRLKVVLDNPMFPNIEWRYEITKARYWRLNDAVQDVIGPFQERSDQIRGFLDANAANASVKCDIYGDQSVLVLCVDAETVAELTKLRCSFSFSMTPLELRAPRP